MSDTKRSKTAPVRETSQLTLSYKNGEITPAAKSLLPHKHKKQPKKAAFFISLHKSDTFITQLIRMRPPSIPVISRDDPDNYFIYWNHDVPWQLWDKYAPRKRKRIVKKDNINRYRGEERERYAEERRLIWEYALQKLNYDPFEDELRELLELSESIARTRQKVSSEEERQTNKAALSEEERRKEMPVNAALEAFLESRKRRKLAPVSITAYGSTIDWILEGLAGLGYEQLKIGELRHLHLSETLNYIAEEREWVATTINKGVDFMMTVFNWLETEEYINRNPSKGKFIKLPAYKTKHRWYDRDTAATVKQAVLAAGNDKLYRAMQFTYWLMIRSKQELRKLRVGDIDTTLKRIRFSAALSKSNTETFRDYTDEFGKIIQDMQLAGYPKDYFVFGGKSGDPGPSMCGHNFFSKQFKSIKDGLGLSMDYTIYGWKHTRIVHELMKGTDGYDISYIARHEDPKSTREYMRDYDITLNTVYKPEDLTF